MTRRCQGWVTAMNHRAALYGQCVHQLQHDHPVPTVDGGVPTRGADLVHLERQRRRMHGMAEL